MAGGIRQWVDARRRRVRERGESRTPRPARSRSARCATSSRATASRTPRREAKPDAVARRPQPANASDSGRRIAPDHDPGVTAPLSVRRLVRPSATSGIAGTASCVVLQRSRVLTDGVLRLRAHELFELQACVRCGGGILVEPIPGPPGMLSSLQRRTQHHFLPFRMERRLLQGFAIGQKF